MGKRTETKELEELAIWPELRLKPNDGVMILVVREDGAKEVYFPQLGLLTEGRIEQAQMDMYRGLLRARAEQAGGGTQTGMEDESDGA